MRKNTVAATIEMEMIQKEMATVSLGFRNPCKSRAILMLTFGYTGEAHLCPGGAWVGFAGGMCGWFFILFEIFGGEAGSVAGELGSANKFTQASFGTMRLIVTAGWSIYPAGYFFGYLMGGVNDCSLNLIYNLADFVNKIAFCLAIWQAAKNESLS
jgi:hypothetical protein